VAPTAVPGGEVRVGRGSCIMHGAVVAAEGGPVEIGAHCVIMENAVLRAGRARRSGPDDVVEEVLDSGDDLAQDGGGQGQRARQDYCCGCGTHTAIDQRSKLCPPCYMHWPCQPVMGAGRPGASTAGGRAGRRWWNCRVCGRHHANPGHARMRAGRECRVPVLAIFDHVCENSRVASRPGSSR